MLQPETQNNLPPHKFPLHQLPVRVIMQVDVVTIREDQLVVDAAQAMETFNFRRLPVLGQDGSLVGIVTDADVLEAETAARVYHTYQPQHREQWLTVGDIMTREVVTIGPDATVGEMAATLIEHKIGGLPVVETVAQHADNNPDKDAGRDAGKSPHGTARSARIHPVRLMGIVTEMDIFLALRAAWQADQSDPTA